MNAQVLIRVGILGTTCLSFLQVVHAESKPESSYPLIPSVEEIWREPSIEVGIQKQLLTDDYVLSHRFNVHREFHAAEKVNDGKPLLIREKPWERANLFQVASVHHDGSRFQMNYGYVGPVEYCCRAESTDGIKWNRPSLGIVEFANNRDNNLFDYRGYVMFLDPHETDPQHRFKATYRPLESSSLPHAACLAHSPDGMHWTPYNDGKPVTERAADTLSQMVWDERGQVYRLFTRTDFGLGGGQTEYRGAREMVNPDLKANPTNWTTVKNWIFEREGRNEVKRRQIHTVNFWQHEGIDFGLMVVMEWPAFNEKPIQVGNDGTRHERDVWNCYLATRRGGHAAEWDCRWIYDEKQFIPRGGEGCFDKDLIHPAANIVTYNDEHWIYYTGWPIGHMRHPYHPAIGLAKVKLDRFVSLQPWNRRGKCWIITKPFQLKGRRLELNGDFSEGMAQASILDINGQAIEGFSEEDSIPVEGEDRVRLSVNWEHGRDMSELKDRVVRLRVEWEKGDLFAFQFLD